MSDDSALAAAIAALERIETEAAYALRAVVPSRVSALEEIAVLAHDAVEALRDMPVAPAPSLAAENAGLRALLGRVMPEQNVAAVTTARTADGRVWCAMKEGDTIRVWQGAEDGE